MDLKKNLLYKALKRHKNQNLKDLEKLGLTRSYISKLCKEGFIERVHRGTYKLPSKKSQETKVIELLKEASIIRTKEFEEHGIPRYLLQEFVNEGIIHKIGHGLYSLPEAEYSLYTNFAEVTKKNPNAVICLLSSLSYYNITTQIPHEIWICIQYGNRAPKIQSPPIKVTRLSGEAFTQGIEEIIIDGVKVKIYNPAKTVADCFKFRNKVGIDIAIEALKMCLQNKMCTLNDIDKYAKIDKVDKVIKPYVETLI